MGKSLTTRRAVLSGGIAAAAAPAAAHAADAGKLLLQPTELGREMLQLFPAYAEAVWFGGHSDDADEPTVWAWQKRTGEPIEERAVRATNVVDLAIAHCIFAEFGDDELANKLADAVLTLAGIPLVDCSIGHYHHHRKRNCRPTAAELREVMAREGLSDAELAEWRRVEAEAALLDAEANGEA